MIYTYLIFLILLALLETKLDHTTPSFIRMTKEFFDTCMDTSEYFSVFLFLNEVIEHFLLCFQHFKERYFKENITEY